MGDVVAEKSVNLGGCEIKSSEVYDKLIKSALAQEQAEIVFNNVRAMLEEMEKNNVKEEVKTFQGQVEGNVTVDFTGENNGVITIDQQNTIYNITINGAAPEGEGEKKEEAAPEGEGEKKEEAAPEGEGGKREEAAPEGEGEKREEAAPEGEGEKREEAAPEGEGEKKEEAAPEGEGEKKEGTPPVNPEPVRPEKPQMAEPEIPESPERAYDEIQDIMRLLSVQLVPDQTGSIVLTGEQMQKIHRISLLRAPFFGAGIPKQLAEAMGRKDLITADDLRNEKTIKEAKKRIKKQMKEEKKYNKELDKLVDQYVDYLNAKNSTNYTLNKVSALGNLNEILEQGQYINTPLAFMPEVSPLIVNICQKGNREKLSAGQHIQVVSAPGQMVDVYPESLSSSARESVSYLATCGGGYSNVLEKFFTENTKMSQGQARSMVNTVTSVGLIAGIIGIGYWLFTKEDETEGGGRSFSFPSLGKLAAVIGIPMALNYGSQMATGDSLMTNLARLWKTGEFPWSSSENVPAHEAIASQQVMGQFVLLGVPKSTIKQYATFSGGRMTKIDLGGLRGYLQEYENTLAKPEEKPRIGAQIAAIDKINNDDNARSTLYAYIERLGITESELDSDPTGNINERLGDANAKYQKLEDYIKARGLLVDPAKKDKVVETLFNEKELNDKVFDKLKEDGCFITDPNSERYSELSKLHITDEKKMKIYETYTKLGLEGTKYGHMELKVDGEKLKLTSGSGNKEILLNPDLTIDDFVDAAGNKLVFKDEEEWLRTGLLINQIKSSTWEEIPKAEKRNAPFELTSGIKFWESIQFAKFDGSECVLSNFLPFISEMDKNHPTIEKDNNRQFFVNYLNKLWKTDHPNS